MEKFSIGMTARLMGISTHTLRFYSNEGLVTPEYVDEKTGYRYYTFHQLHYIDRIKYLRAMHIPLKEIKIALQNQSTESLLPFLKKRKEAISSQLEELALEQENLQWYIDYFEYPKKRLPLRHPYIVHFSRRYAMATSVGWEESVSQVETRLDEIRSESKLNIQSYLRQWGYTLDYDSFCRGTFTPKLHYMFLKECPKTESNQGHIVSFPPGDYLCLMARIRDPQFDLSSIAPFFETDNKGEQLLLANEYEDHLSEFSRCPYEVQLYLG